MFGTGPQSGLMAPYNPLRAGLRRPQYPGVIDEAGAIPLSNGFSLAPVSVTPAGSGSRDDNVGTPSPQHRLAPMGANGGMFGNPDRSGGFTAEMPNGMASINEALESNALLGEQKKAKRQKTLQKVGQALQAGIAGYLAGRGNPAGMATLQNIHAMRLNQQETAAREALKMRELEAKRYEPTQVGDSLVQLDRVTGEYKPLFRDPQPFEAYAAALGLEPGTAEYMKTVQDYRLGAWSDPALENRIDLEGVRFDHRGQLQDKRYEYIDQIQDKRLAVTRRGQDITRDNNIRSTRQSDTNNRRSTGQSDKNNARSTATSRANNVQNSYTRMKTSKKAGLGNIVKVNSPAEAARLAPGTQYMRPDGVVMTR